MTIGENEAGNTEVSPEVEASTEGNPEVETQDIQTSETKEEDAIRTELETLRKEKEDLLNELKTHRATRSLDDRSINEIRKLVSRVEEKQTARLDALAEIIEARALSETEAYSEPQKPKSLSYKERMQEIDKKYQSTEAEFQTQRVKGIATEILKLTKPLNLELDKSEELSKAYIKWLERDYEGALNFVKETVTKMTEKKNNPVEDERDKKIAELEKRLAKAEALAKGELNSETGLPRGAAKDDKTIKENYRNNPNDPVAYREFKRRWEETGGKF